MAILGLTQGGESNNNSFKIKWGYQRVLSHWNNEENISPDESKKLEKCNILIKNGE